MSAKPYIVGIAGGSASGKSTLSRTLEEALQDTRLLVFHMDAYFRPEAQRPYVHAPYGEGMYVDNNHPETMDLARLQEDLQSAAASGEWQVILVEGLLTLWHDGIRGLLDLKLFVDCRADERIVRRVRRNMGWGESFDQVTGVYLDLVRHRHETYVEPSRWHADLVINGSNPSQTALEILETQIRGHL